MEDYYGEEFDKSPNPAERKKNKKKSSKKKNKVGFTDEFRQQMKDGDFDEKGEY